MGRQQQSEVEVVDRAAGRAGEARRTAMENVLLGALAMALLATVHLVVIDVGSAGRLVRALATLARMRLAYLRAALSAEGVTSETHAHCAAMLADMLLAFGGVWAKSGQFAALRGDLIPEEYMTELARCQDQLPPRPFAEVRRSIERELGCDLYDVFESVDETCISCATIAQVHRGRLREGDVRDVAIKVQHPDVERKILKDLRVVWLVFRIVRALLPGLQSLQICALYLLGTTGELDFCSEARSMSKIRRNLERRRSLRPEYLVPFTRALREWDFDRLRPGTRLDVRFNPEDPESSFVPATLVRRKGASDNFEVRLPGSDYCMIRNVDDVMLTGDPLFVDVTIPRVVDRLVSKRLLVMSFEEGRVTKQADPFSMGHEDLCNQTTMVARAFTHMAFVDCFAHGDPHPANILYSPGKPPVILDFGFCMRLREDVVRGWCKVIYGAAELDLETLEEGLEELGFRYRKELPGNKREQALQVAQAIFQSAAEERRNASFKDIDRRLVVDTMFRNGLASYDLLFMMRITNYLGNLCTRAEIQSLEGVLPQYASKSMADHGWHTRNDLTEPSR